MRQASKVKKDNIKYKELMETREEMGVGLGEGGNCMDSGMINQEEGLKLELDF